MANIKSQIKRIRTAERQRLRNKSVRSSLRTSMRRFNEAVESGDKDTAESTMKSVIRELDRAAVKGVFHKNNVANKKSSLVKRYNALLAS